MGELQLAWVSDHRPRIRHAVTQRVLDGLNRHGGRKAGEDRNVAKCVTGRQYIHNPAAVGDLDAAGANNEDVIDSRFSGADDFLIGWEKLNLDCPCKTLKIVGRQIRIRRVACKKICELPHKVPLVFTRAPLSS